MVTLTDALKKLPRFARGLGKNCEKLETLRYRVGHELREYQYGDNPLTPNQANALGKFIKYIGG